MRGLQSPAAHGQLSPAMKCLKKDEVVWGNLWQSSTSALCVSNMCPVRSSCSRAGAAVGLLSCPSIKPMSLLPLVGQPHFHKLASLPKQGQGFVLAEEKTVVEHIQSRCSRRNKLLPLLQPPGGREGVEAEVARCQDMN